MLIVLQTLLMLDSSDVIMAAGFGSCCSLLMALRKGRPFSLVIGWTLTGFGAGFYIGAKVAKMLSIEPAAGAFAVSASSVGWAKAVIEALPKYIEQKMGVATDNDATDPNPASDRASLFEREDTSHGSERLG